VAGYAMPPIAWILLVVLTSAAGIAIGVFIASRT
jgi:uncharacterized protein YneF (UPF0154 family)